eukprot:TRINITY_DN701_c0_g1_i1.p3 TRINITY_DN701_c0_g1~~TRINITY_DN701_c0_g1_i1.p3  ORF type:complete len:169 (+),score=13.17 TRINITY_DN701_c0_g1_i1:755-1261(+)
MLEVFVGQHMEPEKKKAISEIHTFLHDLCRVYKYEMDDMTKLFHQVSCSRTNLKRYLRGKNVSLWTKEEDYALAHPENEAVYNKLLSSKRPEDIERRKKYLEINQFALIIDYKTCHLIVITQYMNECQDNAIIMSSHYNNKHTQSGYIANGTLKSCYCIAALRASAYN